MEIKEYIVEEIKVAEVISNEILIQHTDDALDLMGNLYYQGYDKIIIHQKNITPDFFDLKNKMAGDILQKFSNYRFRLVIVGEFSHITSKSLKAFIYESNKGKQVNFLSSLNEVLKLKK
ncbi:alpha/beta hydrolase [Salegentibacter salinarum]|uniref:Alpha/beta hydrolase n=1 Tax=Salegentibacter salinarum TaxID=447422 RepID=A0A2N0U1I5_9FLAO|nr:DUF4180 domain-containing protein [Salegentibacter salinarum]PKD20839.1 alpha/beta hydrolase [Salegentibacter salinarum]SKB78418.1 protein of unknown function [Salegentibacter salinarum]